MMFSVEEEQEEQIKEEEAEEDPEDLHIGHPDQLQIQRDRKEDGKPEELSGSGDTWIPQGTMAFRKYSTPIMPCRRALNLDMPEKSHRPGSPKPSWYFGGESPSQKVSGDRLDGKEKAEQSAPAVIAPIAQLQPLLTTVHQRLRLCRSLSIEGSLKALDVSSNSPSPPRSPGSIPRTLGRSASDSRHLAHKPVTRSVSIDTGLSLSRSYPLFQLKVRRSYSGIRIL